jgi:hypothetical protein
MIVDKLKMNSLIFGWRVAIHPPMCNKYQEEHAQIDTIENMNPCRRSIYSSDALDNDFFKKLKTSVSSYCKY